MGASGNPAIYFYDRIILISTLACHIKDAIPPSQRRIGRKERFAMSLPTVPLIFFAAAVEQQ